MSVPHTTPGQYRPDIDGLRSIAVLGVVLYHASPRIVPGGFVGVDVFFVISGFLITSILLRQMENGTLSIKTFYERRIKRIMPALFAVFAAVMAFGFLKMTPWDFKALAASAQYTLYSLSNVHFLHVTGNYFDASADAMPLLHTWSLGVEEQFYFGFPVILLIGMRCKCSRRQLFFLLLGLGICSLALCLWKIQTKPSKCFYLIPYRAWELLAGALLAFRVPQLGNGKKADAAGLLGLSMIAGAMAFYDKNTLFPGAAALLPCAGAALVIAAGRENGAISRRILGCRPLVWIGLISYSVYLWHWPLLAFETYLGANSAQGTSEWVRMGIGLSSLPVGYLSWKFVEQPLRAEKFKGWKLFAGWAGISAVFLAFSLWAHKTNGFESWAAPEIQKIALARRETPAWQKDLGLTAPPLSAAQAPVYGDTSQVPRIALWGDSHAYALKPFLEQECRAHGASFRFYGRAGAVPLIGIRVHDNDRSGYQDEALRLIETDSRIDTVILAARWAWPLKGGTAAHGPAEKGKPAGRLMDGKDGAPLASDQEAEAQYDSAVRRTLGRLMAANKRVVLVYPWPETGYNIPELAARELSLGRNPEAFRIPAQKIFFERQAPVFRIFDGIPPDARLAKVKPHALLIENGNITLFKNGNCLYKDGDHLNAHGIDVIKHLLTGPLFGSVRQPPEESAAPGTPQKPIPPENIPAP